jgi:hypothetical protein
MLGHPENHEMTFGRVKLGYGGLIFVTVFHQLCMLREALSAESRTE